jgi:hypothetical protein
MESKFREFFFSPSHRIIHKWDHYFNIYERHFKKFADKGPVNILEIGIYKGGSIEMWIDYLGKDNCNIYAIDINPECKILETLFDNVKIFIGDQADKNFLMDVKNQIPELDIIIDDGGHTMEQQINTFEVMYDHVKPDGVFLCEDVHTSYWEEYGGGYKRPGSFIEYIKNYIDKLYTYYSRESGLQSDKYSQTMDSLHFYDSIVIIEKLMMEKKTPVNMMRGDYDLNGEKISEHFNHHEFVRST